MGLRIFPTEDLYAVLAGWEGNGESASFKVFVNPLMIFLWLGGLVLALGTLTSLWPHSQAARVPASVPSAAQPKRA